MPLASYYSTRSFCFILDIFLLILKSSPKQSASMVRPAYMLSVFNSFRSDIKKKKQFSKYTSLSNQSEISQTKSRAERARKF